MITRLHGCIHSLEEFSAIIMAGPIGYAVTVPDVSRIVVGTEVELVIYHHWSAEKGPALFGFSTSSERQLFMDLISVPKIGPSIAVSLMAQGGLSGLCDILVSQDADRLSSFSGIGPKKAAHIIASLSDVIQKRINTGLITVDRTSTGGALYEVQEALKNLNYSSQEITQVMQYLAQLYAQESPATDVLLRSALSFLSKHAS